jgi:hypothetical protein
LRREKRESLRERDRDGNRERERDRDGITEREREREERKERKKRELFTISFPFFSPPRPLLHDLPGFPGSSTEPPSPPSYTHTHSLSLSLSNTHTLSLSNIHLLSVFSANPFPLSPLV